LIAGFFGRSGDGEIVKEAVAHEHTNFSAVPEGKYIVYLE